MEIYELLFILLRAGLFDCELTDADRELLVNEEKRVKIFKAAKKHDISHLAAYSYIKLGLADESSDFYQKCLNCQLVAVYRYENLQHELDRICKTLDGGEIPFILLKGSVLRQYYPEPWMRTSCDIDVLIEKKDLDRARSLLESELNYEYKYQSGHDISLFSSSNVHLELHYTLIEDNTMGSSEAGLEYVWKEIELLSDCTCGYKMTEQMFYYYHILHLAKHLKSGGCGIKPILDLYILKNKGFDRNAVCKYIKTCGLSKMEAAADRLADVWFGSADYDETTQRLADYILLGGVYGNMENSVAISQGISGGEVKNFFNRIFLPHNLMVHRYPSLKKRKWAYPLYHFRRWFDIMFEGKAGKAVAELKTNRTISKEKVDSAAKMWSDLGL